MATTTTSVGQAPSAATASQQPVPSIPKAPSSTNISSGVDPKIDNALTVFFGKLWLAYDKKSNKISFIKKDNNEVYSNDLFKGDAQFEGLEVYIKRFKDSSTNADETVKFLEANSSASDQLSKEDNKIIEIINELLKTNSLKKDIAEKFINNLYKLQVQILLLRIKKLRDMPVVTTKIGDNKIVEKYDDLLGALTRKFEILSGELNRKDTLFNTTIDAHNKSINTFETNLKKKEGETISKIDKTQAGGSKYKHKYEKYKAKYEQLKNNL